MMKLLRCVCSCALVHFKYNILLGSGDCLCVHIYARICALVIVRLCSCAHLTDVFVCLSSCALVVVCLCSFDRVCVPLLMSVLW